MINVSGNVYVTNLKELSPRLVGGTVYSFEKVKDTEEYKTTFVKAKFVGEALVFLISKGIKDKDKVFIKSGVLKSNEWKANDGTEHKVLEMTVFDLDFAEERQYKDTPFEEKKENKSNNSKFKR